MLWVEICPKDYYGRSNLREMKHRDRLTLIMFRFLKCSKSQTWLHIYEAKMHLLFILGSEAQIWNVL